jgi:hypothetical protein
VFRNIAPQDLPGPFPAVQLFNGEHRVSIVDHQKEPEAAALPRLVIGYDLYVLNLAEFREQVAEVALANCGRQISDENVCHWNLGLWRNPGPP